MSASARIVVLGSGAWGTALAVLLAREERPVVLVPRRTDLARQISAQRTNDDYLPGVRFPSSLAVVAYEHLTVLPTDRLLLACPTEGIRTWCEHLRSQAAIGAMPLVSLAKGLEATTHLRPSEIIQEVLPGSRVATLSGPSNAEEVALGMPTAVVLASNQIHGERISELQAALSARSFRVYASDDLTGVELGGCLKNIYAIAAGCCDGLKLGDNAKSAMLTRALSEMVRLGQLLGARAETFYGLGGFGDLVATAHGSWSRNRTFGQRIAEGTPARVLIENRRTVVEGYRSALSFFELCRTRGIEAPILAEVHAILYADKPPAAALQSLMSRELKRE